MEAPSANISTLSGACQSLFIASGATYLGAHTPRQACICHCAQQLCEGLLVPFLPQMQHVSALPHKGHTHKCHTLMAALLHACDSHGKLILARASAKTVCRGRCIPMLLFGMCMQ